MEERRVLTLPTQKKPRYFVLLEDGLVICSRKESHDRPTSHMEGERSHAHASIIGKGEGRGTERPVSSMDGAWVY